MHSDLNLTKTCLELKFDQVLNDGGAREQPPNTTRRSDTKLYSVLLKISRGSSEERFASSL